MTCVPASAANTTTSACHSAVSYFQVSANAMFHEERASSAAILWRAFENRCRSEAVAGYVTPKVEV